MKYELASRIANSMDLSLCQDYLAEMKWTVRDCETDDLSTLRAMVIVSLTQDLTEV